MLSRPQERGGGCVSGDSDRVEPVVSRYRGEGGARCQLHKGCSRRPGVASLAG
jgi:hypothetical protein